MSLRTRKDIYSAASILNIKKGDIDFFLKDKIKVENFNKFIVIKDTRDCPKLSWVEIGKSDLSIVEVTDGLEPGDIVYILPSNGLLDYQEQFRKRVEASISIG